MTVNSLIKLVTEWGQCLFVAILGAIFGSNGRFFKWANPGLFFVYFRSFQTQFLQKKTVEVCGIRTWIVQVEGKQADHLTTTTAQRTIIIPTKQCKALQAT